MQTNASDVAGKLDFPGNGIDGLPAFDQTHVGCAFLINSTPRQLCHSLGSGCQRIDSFFRLNPGMGSFTCYFQMKFGDIRSLGNQVADRPRTVKTKTFFGFEMTKIELFDAAFGFLFNG